MEAVNRLPGPPTQPEAARSYADAGSIRLARYSRLPRHPGRERRPDHADLHEHASPELDSRGHADRARGAASRTYAHRSAVIWSPFRWSPGGRAVLRR